MKKLKIQSTAAGGAIVATVDRIQNPENRRVGQIRLWIEQEVRPYRGVGFSHGFFLSESDCDELIAMLQKARGSSASEAS